MIPIPAGGYEVQFATAGGRSKPVCEPLPNDLGVETAPAFAQANVSLVNSVVSFVRGTGSGPEFVEIGDWLGTLLLRGQVAAEFEARVMNADPGTVRVLLQVDATDLAALPWEFMRRDGVALFTKPGWPMSRAPGLRPDKQQELVPLRLLAIEGPSDEDIGSGGEINEIIAARPAWDGRLEWRLLRQPTQERFSAVYEAFRPHVLHFAGHAIHDPATGQPSLVVRDWRLTRDYIINGIDHVPRLVVLNACRSDGDAVIVQSLTDAFVRRKAAAVIGMRGDIRGKAAGCFGKALYRALAESALVDEAVSTARQAMYRKFGNDGQQRDWGLPALTLRVLPEQVLPIRCGELSSNQLSYIKSHLVEPTRLFVDRVDARWNLASAVDPDAGAARQMVLVSGPKDVGKSWLLHHLRMRCALRGRRVRYIQLGGLTRWGFVDLLKLIAKTDDDISSRSPGGDAYRRFYHDASFLLHSKRPQEPVGALPAQMPSIPQELELAGDSVADLFASFRTALAGDAEQSPLLLILDDLQGMYDGDFQQRVFPYLVKEIADDRVAGVQTVVALRTEDRAAYLPPNVQEVWAEERLGLMQSDDFPELARELVLLLGETVDDMVEAVVKSIHKKWYTGPWSLRRLESFREMTGL